MEQPQHIVRRRSHGPFQPYTRRTSTKNLKKQQITIPTQCTVTSTPLSVSIVAVEDLKNSVSKDNHAIDFAVESSRPNVSKEIIELDDGEESDIEILTREDREVQNMSDSAQECATTIPCENNNQSVSNHSIELTDESSCSSIQFNGVESVTYADSILEIVDSPILTHSMSVEKRKENNNPMDVFETGVPDSFPKIILENENDVLYKETNAISTHTTVEPASMVKCSAIAKNFSIKNLELQPLCSNIDNDVKSIIIPFKIVLRDCLQHIVDRSCTVSMNKCMKSTMTSESSASASSKKHVANVKVHTLKPSMTNNRVINLSENTSSEKYCETFEDSVAQKLSKLPTKLNCSKICDNVKPTDISLNLTSPKRPKLLDYKVTKSHSSLTNTIISTTCNNSIFGRYTSGTKNGLIHPSVRMKLRTDPKTNVSISSLTTSELSTLENLEKIRKYDVFEISDSETFTTSTVSDDITSIPSPLYDIKEEEEIETSDEQFLFVPAVKKEIKKETNNEIKSRYLFGDDEEVANILEAYDCVERQRRKSSPRKSAETCILGKPSNSNVRPTFIQSASTDARHGLLNSSNIAVENRYNGLEKPKVKLVKLGIETTKNLIDLCCSNPAWNDRNLLLKCGLSIYDIERLGSTALRRKQITSYKLRQVLKKNRIYEPDQTKRKKKLRRTNDEKKALQAKKRRTEKMRSAAKKERQEKELASIRRSLLRINSRFLNQNRFWNFLKQGSSPDKAIII